MIVWLALGALVAGIGVLAHSRDSSDGPPAHRKPPALRRGDRIALVAPAGPVDDATVRAVMRALSGQGFEPEPWIPDRPARGYLAADDDARAAAFNGAVRDPEVRAILCLRGGYGTPRILDRIDFAALRADPKIVIGYSDITALLIAVQRRAGLIAFHGPVGRELVAKGSADSPLTKAYLWDALRGETSEFGAWGKRATKRLRAIAPGRAEGTLTGGNLSLVAATIGTPYEIDTRGAILFLEDVNEKAFRIDRMLAQLRLAGKLANVRGVVLGSFTGCGRESGAISLGEVFRDYFVPLGVPIVEGFPSGHGLRDHVTLPFGARVRLDAGALTLTLLESPVAPR